MRRFKFRWSAVAWWGYGDIHAVVRAWTQKGARREMRLIAKRVKPKADIVGVGVTRLS